MSLCVDRAGNYSYKYSDQVYILNSVTVTVLYVTAASAVVVTKQYPFLSGVSALCCASCTHDTSPTPF